MKSSLYPLSILTLFIILVSGCGNGSDEQQLSRAIQAGEINEIPVEPEVDSYGFETDTFESADFEIRRNESFYIILDRFNVSPARIYEIQQAATGDVNLSRMIPGQTYTIYSRADSAKGMVWNIDKREYIVLDWSSDETIEIERKQRELIVREREATGIIQSSLYQTLQDENLPDLLGAELADILAWQIDFFALQKNDSFKVIYEELYVDDEYYGLGDVKAVEFDHWGETFYGYYFENGDRSGYFDREGNSLQKALLQAPFRYSQRISSGFSSNRLHPIYNVRRPHNGVDYAAPTGTPILAAGDGRVTEAQYRGANGNIVQITHNSVYQTAYLHLSRFAQGIRPGVNVKQGQIIGYVGQTGAATGPHLHYELKVNGNPVNSRTIDLPASEALEQQYMTEFNQLRMMLDYRLSGLDQEQQYVTFNTAAVVSGRN